MLLLDLSWLQLRSLLSSTARTFGRVAVAPRCLSTVSPLTVLTAEEEMIRDSAAKFANAVIKPRVRQMDESMTMAPEVIKGLFENGVRHNAR